MLRLSLAPTALADVAAGLAHAAHGGFPSDARAWWLFPASFGVYHGALALNDWRDREHDARTRPDRPIPSGAVAPNAALLAGLALVALGLTCAALAGTTSLVWMSVVAALALAYDFFGRGAWSGPLLLAACRAGNLGSGIAWTLSRDGALDPDSPVWMPCALYGLYVFFVSRLGRMEDAEDAEPVGDRPRALLVTLGVILCAPAALSEHTAGIFASLAAGGLAAYGLVAFAVRTSEWTRSLVERAMGLALRRMLVFDACVVLAWLDVDQGRRGLFGFEGGNWQAPFVAVAILGGYPLARGLRKVFPPS